MRVIPREKPATRVSGVVRHSVPEIHDHGITIGIRGDRGTNASAGKVDTAIDLIRLGVRAVLWAFEKEAEVGLVGPMVVVRT